MTRIFPFLIVLLGLAPHLVAADKSLTIPWTDTPPVMDGTMGEGTLVYPGPDYTLIPSIRLANVREGLEDYEYFALLKKEAARLDPARHARLREQVRAALQIEPDLVSSVHVWTKDPARLEAKRQQLADLIRKVRKAAPDK